MGDSDLPVPSDEGLTYPDLQFNVELSRGEGEDVNIRIVPPAGAKRTPTSLVCVVDTSGSMGSPADNPDGGERTGLSLLDVVKHALKAVIHTLGQEDSFALVSFSTRASVELSFTTMDEAGLKEAIDAVNKLQPDGTTNMWDGMENALDLLRSSGDPSKQSAVFVFTDGVPNCIPPQGHQEALRAYQQQHKVRANMSCFGFGYNLDSALLDEMSSLGGGVYSFIPDVGMVGTVFVHAISNLLSCAASACIVTVETKDGGALNADDLPLSNTSSLVETPHKLSFDLGMVNFGQSRDVVVRTTKPSDLCVTVQCQVPWGNVRSVGVFGPDNPVRCSVQKARAQVVRSIVDARRLGQKDGDLNSALAAVENVAGQIRKLVDTLSGGDDDADEKYASDLLQDLEGQIAMSLSRNDWFRRWGIHYLPSIQRAHVLQQCLNFKDPGMQHYGGELFRDVRDAADDRFNELPAPTPSIPQGRPSWGGYTPTPNAMPINMATFNNLAAVASRRVSCFWQQASAGKSPRSRQGTASPWALKSWSWTASWRLASARIRWRSLWISGMAFWPLRGIRFAPQMGNGNFQPTSSRLSASMCPLCIAFSWRRVARTPSANGKPLPSAMS
jgi:hypothetical protein